MTANVKYAAGEDYRWSSSAFKWTSAESGKKWRDTHLIVITLTVSEIIALSESIGKKVELPLSERFGATDSANRALSLFFSERLTTTEAGRRTLSYARSFSTALFLIEAAQKNTAIKVNERISVAEKQAALVDFFRTFDEKMVFSECYTDGIGFLLALNESFGVADGIDQSVSYIREMYESFGIKGSQAKELISRLAESFLIDSEYWGETDFNRKPSESFGISEHQGKSISQANHELLTLKERVFKGVALGLSERLVTSESFNNRVAFYRKALEKFSVTDHSGKSIVSDKFEEMGIEDGQSKQFIRNVSESFGMMESFARLVIYSRDIDEGISVGDAIKKNISLSLVELMGIYDQIIRNSGSVISDMIINGLSITETDFERLLDRSAPVGYEEFQTFITGDYEYSEALFKVAFNSNTTDLAAVDGLKVEVDLPDIFDSGKAVVTGSLFRVNFNRLFNAIPEVGVVLSGGTVFAIPNVVADISGFTVTLRREDGSPANGVISWRAHGY